MLGTTSCSSFVRRYGSAMPPWAERQALISTVAFALRQSRSLLRRIAAEKHPPLDGEPDPAQMAAEKIVEQLELSRYEVREREEQPRRRSSP